MKIEIDWDEAYPVYGWRRTIERSGPFSANDCVVDVPEETLSRWLIIEKQFDELQRELASLIGR